MPAFGCNTVFLLFYNLVSNKSWRFLAVVFAEKFEYVLARFYGSCHNKSKIITDFPTPV